jgi:hypothetical protein
MLNMEGDAVLYAQSSLVSWDMLNGPLILAKVSLLWPTSSIHQVLLRPEVSGQCLVLTCPSSASACCGRYSE